jgi:hypothetical protein
LSGGHTMLTSGDVLAANDHLHLPLAALVREALRAFRAAPRPATGSEKVEPARP